MQTQILPVLSGCEMIRFCYMTESIIHFVHDCEFETPWFNGVNCEQLYFFRSRLFITFL